MAPSNKRVSSHESREETDRFQTSQNPSPSLSVERTQGADTLSRLQATSSRGPSSSFAKPTFLLRKPTRCSLGFSDTNYSRQENWVDFPWTKIGQEGLLQKFFTHTAMDCLKVMTVLSLAVHAPRVASRASRSVSMLQKSRPSTQFLRNK